MIFIAACISKPTPPSGSVDEEKMANILAEIHLAEAKVNRMNLQNYDSSTVAYKELERRILKKYNVDSSTYRKTYDFYAANPALMLSAYEKTLKVLEAKKVKKEF